MIEHRFIANSLISSCEVSFYSEYDDIEIGDIQPICSELILKTNESESLNNSRLVLRKPTYADILIADDSALNLLAIRSQLSKISPSSSCDQALNGLEAVELFQERMKICTESNWLVKPYGIILIDYNMPQCDGPTAIKKIRSICEEIKKEDI
jgi:CheY-like chemotaxis protein